MRKERYESLLVLLAIVVWLLFPSCNKKDPFMIRYDYDYYPLSLGHYIIYDVDSVSSYNSIFTKDTARYQIKELVADTFYDNLNQLSYRLELYRRANDSSTWDIDRVWYATRTKMNLQKVEDDLRFVKLIFPPKANDSWDGNIFIPKTDPFDEFEDWNYHYEEVGVPYTVNGLNFDTSLIAINVNDSNYIEKRLRKEVYAKGIGLIYQEWELLSKPVSDGWETDRWKGFRIRMKIKTHYP